ncbi:MAG TPA: SIMPL domain-containing protein, partial [Candidatus Nanopelagicales bacterium]|nr:SIMPL domain-containing protein [Candidatus Nanopelagicales bacterium]
MARTVTVTGRGSASAAYDLATLALGVTARAATPADATARAGYALAQVREAVLGRGVEGSEVATGAVTLVAVHDPWPTVTGYEASFALTVRTEDLGGVDPAHLAERLLRQAGVLLRLSARVRVRPLPGLAYHRFRVAVPERHPVDPRAVAAGGDGGDQ